METNFIPLESIQIATPCHADWDKMSGDDKSRFCGSCAKNVYNLSAMTRAQAQQLILEKEGHLCIQLHRREDGTVITTDCPVGISPAKRSAGAFRTLMATAMAAVLAVFGVQNARAAAKKNGPVVKGGITAPKPVPHATVRGEMPKIMGKIAMPTPTPAPKPQSIQVMMGDMAVAPPKPAAQPTKAPTKPAATRPSGHAS